MYNSKDRFKYAVNTRLAALQSDNDDNLRVIYAAAETEPLPAKDRRFYARSVKRPRPLRVIFIIILCIVLTITTVFAASPGVRQWLGNLFGLSATPEFGEQLQEIQTRCENAGIEFELISAAATEDIFVLIYSLRDIEQDRVDKSTACLGDILTGNEDPYYFSNLGSTIYNEEYFDEETRTLYHIEIREISEEMPHWDSTLMYRCNEIFSMAILDYFDTGIDLSEASDTQDYNLIGMGWDWNWSGIEFGGPQGDMAFALFFEDSLPTLVPKEQMTPIPGMSSAFVSNVAFLNDQLHIQLYFTSEAYTELAIMDDSGKTAGNMLYFMNYSASYWGMQGQIVETVFDYSISTITENLRVGAFYNRQKTNVVYGDWSVTFDLGVLPAVVIDKTQIQKASNAALINEIQRISVTPFTVTLEGTQGDPFGFDISIRLAGGRIVKANVGGFLGYDYFSGGFKYFYVLQNEEWMLDSINLNEMEAVIINGVEIEL